MLNTKEYLIHRAEEDEYLEDCARLMAESSPWKTFGTTYTQAIAIIEGNEKERYIALHQEKMLGFVTLQMGGALRGYIQDIAVVPVWQGQGVGNQLLQYAEERIFRDARNVFLCVSSFNHRAQQLYQKRGYATVGILHDYLLTGMDEILMRKTRGPLLAQSNTLTS